MVQLWLAALLIVVGSVLALPPIVLLGLVLGFAEGAAQLWKRRALREIEYTRRLRHTHAVVGDPLPVEVTVWNRKVLPLAWLRTTDETSRGLDVVERTLVGTEGGHALSNVWTLGPFERVTRHFNVVAERRGVCSLGPATLEAGDLFARPAASGASKGVDRWLVRPRTVPVALGERERHWGGQRRARHGLVDDPTRYAGVRPYQPGDALRSVHWRATARLGTPVSRLLEPGRHNEVIVVVDMQTVDGIDWATSYDDDAVESLCLAAGSIVCRLRAEGAAVGLAASGYAGTARPFAFVPPGSSNEQVGQCLDLLARLASMPSTRIDRLLTALLRAIRPGTSIVLLGVRDLSPVAMTLRRVAAGGHPIQYVALGADPTLLAAQARAAGIPARAGRLDGSWRTATAMVVE